ncbi:unnamed protein product [Ascophyllum nodosum]
MLTCGEAGSVVHVRTKELAIRRVEHKSLVGDKLKRVPALTGGNESITPSAANLLCFTAGIFIPLASSSLWTGSNACGHPTTSFARLDICTRELYRGGYRV